MRYRIYTLYSTYQLYKNTQRIDRILIKESIAYSVGDFIFKGSRFFLIPFYLSMLSQDEYGVLQQIMIVTSFADAFISLAIKQSMLRMYYDFTTNIDQARYIGNVILYLVVSYSIAIAIFTFTSLFEVTYL